MSAHVLHQGNIARQVRTTVQWREKHLKGGGKSSPLSRRSGTKCVRRLSMRVAPFLEGAITPLPQEGDGVPTAPCLSNSHEALCMPASSASPDKQEAITPPTRSTVASDAARELDSPSLPAAVCRVRREQRAPTRFVASAAPPPRQLAAAARASPGALPSELLLPLEAKRASMEQTAMVSPLRSTHSCSDPLPDKLVPYSITPSPVRALTSPPTARVKPWPACAIDRSCDEVEAPCSEESEPREEEGVRCAAEIEARAEEGESCGGGRKPIGEDGGQCAKENEPLGEEREPRRAEVEQCCDEGEASGVKEKACPAKGEVCGERRKLFGEETEQYGEERQPHAVEGEPCGESEACGGEASEPCGEEWETCGEDWEPCGEAKAPCGDEVEADGWSRDERHVVEPPSLKEPFVDAPPCASVLPVTPVVMLREAEVSQAVGTKEERSVKANEESTFSTETVLDNERKVGEPDRVGPRVERANGVAEMEHEQSASDVEAGAKPDADGRGCAAAAREAAVESETSGAGQVCELELKAKTQVEDPLEDPHAELHVEVETQPGVREAVEEEMGSSIEETSSAPASLTPAVMTGDCLEVESAPAPASPVTATPSSPTRFTPVSTATPVTRTSPGRSCASECSTAPLLPWVRLPTPPLPHPSEQFGLSGPVVAPKGLLHSERWQADSESVGALSPTIVDSGGKRSKGVPQPPPTLLDLRVRREWQEKRCVPGPGSLAEGCSPVMYPPTLASPSMPLEGRPRMPTSPALPVFCPSPALRSPSRVERQSSTSTAARTPLGGPSPNSAKRSLPSPSPAKRLLPTPSPAKRSQPSPSPAKRSLAASSPAKTSSLPSPSPAKRRQAGSGISLSEGRVPWSGFETAASHLSPQSRPHGSKRCARGEPTSLGGPSPLQLEAVRSVLLQLFEAQGSAGEGVCTFAEVQKQLALVDTDDVSGVDLGAVLAQLEDKNLIMRTTGGSKIYQI